MRYNAHRLLHQAANQPCLRCELVITDAQKHKLQTAQKLVRNALRAGLRVAGAYLTQDEVPLVKAHGVPDPAALSFTPKFRTQGSWAYGTLNQPAKACQQLDLDDGMYVPMSIVGLNPAVASNTLFAIVERILGALCDAQGWTLDTSKSICVRVVIDAEAHLDLNIYAIPDVKMALLEKAFHAAANRAMDGSAFSSPPPEIRLDPSEIYVAHRTTGWEQSDPLELEDWFVNAAARHATRSAHACLKCLRPNHGELKANPLKPGVTTADESGTCGDGAHINYAAPAPMLAATLVVQAALEWAAAPDMPGPRVRTRVLDLEHTAPPKDRNWPIEPLCPACQGPVT